ncbi:MAG: hypothetical protein PVH22_01985 [Desulfobacteraceae bacterium]|jgi:hypothetical protein
MADKKKTASENYPLEPNIIIDMSERPAHTSFSRYLTFQDHAGRRKRLKIAFRKTGSLRWESDSFPNGIDALKSLVDTGNRSYWDHLFLENRGGRTTLPIERMQIIMRYQNPPGRSPDHLNHAEIPIVDWPIGMTLFAGHDEICLDEFARRSRYAWAGVEASDPDVIRMVADDLGKSGSDGNGQDQYGQNPKYRDRIDNLCSEFVSWYYYEQNIKVNGKSLRDIVNAQQLHDLFKAEGNLYRYNSGTRLQDFVQAETNQRYTPQPGDYLERRGPDGAEHSMIMYRWLPGDPGAANSHDRYNRAIVFNGPWPVTLRLVRIHEDEKRVDSENGYPKDFWLGKID